MKFAFFPGCAVETTSKAINSSTKKVLENLGIELVELEGWTCCGGSHSQDVSELMSLNMNARNIALAEQMDLPILTVCNTCTLMLRTAKNRLDNDEMLKKQVNAFLSGIDMEYRGTSEIKNMLWVILQEEQLRRLPEKIITPLNGLRIAPFYGCHLLRPSDIMPLGESSINPHGMEKLITLLGAECVDYANRLSCCGYHVAPAMAHIANTIASQNLQIAKTAKAECIVTPCPLCQIQLENGQSQSSNQEATEKNLPIFHLSELLGLAMGISPTEMGLSPKSAACISH